MFKPILTSVRNRMIDDKTEMLNIMVLDMCKHYQQDLVVLLQFTEKKKQNRLLTNRTQFCTADLGFVDVVGGLSVLNAFLGGLKNKIKLYLNEAEMKKKQ